MTVTLHKQIVDLIEDSGLRGMTLNDLCANLCNFDKRTIELLLSRLVKYPPPSHLADIGIAQVQETFGRERRFRYYTVASFRAIIEREKLQDQEVYSSVDFSNVGGFAPLSADLFWETEEERDRRVDSMKGKTNQNAAKKKAEGKKAKKAAVEAGEGEAEVSAKVVKPKRGKKRTLEEEVGDVNADGEDVTQEPLAKKKRGRSPKRKPGEEGVGSVAPEGTPSATQHPVSGEPMTAPPTPAQTPAPKRRGRPPKPKPADGISAMLGEASADATPVSTPTVTPKRRGRPPKRKQSDLDTPSASADPPPPKKRGRPRKSANTPATTTPVEPQSPAPVEDTVPVAAEPSSPQLNGVDAGGTPPAEPSQPSSPRPLVVPLMAEVSEPFSLTYPDGVEDDGSSQSPVQESGQAQEEKELLVRASEPANATQYTEEEPQGQQPRVPHDDSHGRTTDTSANPDASLVNPDPSSNAPQEVAPMEVDAAFHTVVIPSSTGSTQDPAHPASEADPSSSVARTLNGIRTHNGSTIDIPIDPALLSEASAAGGLSTVRADSVSQSIP